MKAVVTLTPSESKRLIAKAVVQMKEVQDALQDAYLLLADGTTNAFIAQELTGDKSIPPEFNSIGLSTDGVLCVTNPATRKNYPNVFFKGQVMKGKTFTEALADHHPKTVVIKGANAFDPNGMVGIITTGFDGGTIPRIIGTVTSKGLAMITPVGLEKLIPSVPNAAKALGGAESIDISLGADGGMFCLCNTKIVTEIEALSLLFGLSAHLICRGGVGGNEGAVTLSIEGDEALLNACICFLEDQIKGEPSIGGNKGDCATCRYKSCRYAGMGKNNSAR